MELLELQNECLQENAKDIESMYETVRSLRHDLKNHLLCISAMAEEQDVDNIIKYMNPTIGIPIYVSVENQFCESAGLCSILSLSIFSFPFINMDLLPHYTLVWNHSV